MAQQNVFDKIREWIGDIAWVIFLWSARLDEEEYFTEVTRAAEQLRAPAEPEQTCPVCKCCQMRTVLYCGYCEHIENVGKSNRSGRG